MFLLYINILEYATKSMMSVDNIELAQHWVLWLQMLWYRNDLQKNTPSQYFCYIIMRLTGVEVLVKSTKQLKWLHLI